MSSYPDWPLNRFPREIDLVGAPWPTAMESQTESFAASIRRNIALTKLQEQPIENDFEIVDVYRSPENERLVILGNLTADREYMDLVCVVGTYSRRQGILCHRLIVGKQSPVIASALAKCKLGVQLPTEVELPWKITAEGFNKALDWCYNAARPDVNDHFEGLTQLFVAARILKMTALDQITMGVLKSKDFSAEFEFNMVAVDENGPCDWINHSFENTAMRHAQCLNVMYSVMLNSTEERSDFASLAAKSVRVIGKDLYSKFIESGVLNEHFIHDVQQVLNLGTEQEFE